MNATLVNLVDPDNPESLKPLIDGGTEGGASCLSFVSSFQSRWFHRFQGSGSRNSTYDHILL